MLAPEGGSKLGNRWQGPATVVKVKSPHSYHIDMGDGSVRKVHANKVRRFVARVQGCGVIADKDVEFGRVLTPVPVVTSVLPSRRVDQDKLTHLDVSERAQLCQLLDEFAVSWTSRVYATWSHTGSRPRRSSCRDKFVRVVCRLCSRRKLIDRLLNCCR